MIVIGCKNLEAEMKRIGVSRNDVAELLSLSYSTIHSRFNGESQWLYKECISIRNKWFSDMELTYLFTAVSTNLRSMN